MPLAELWRRWLHPPALALPPTEVDAVLAAHGAQAWFAYANRAWSRRPQVHLPCRWLARRLPRGSLVVETGCGCALNLLWLVRHGTHRAIGIDVDAAALAAGRELAQRSGSQVDLIAGDARQPPPDLDGGIAALLALNWTYHVPAFDLAGFLAAWRPRLAPDALVAMDFIDGSRPITNLPPEYAWTMTPEALATAAAAAGLVVERCLRRQADWPRLIALLRLPLSA